MCVDVHLGGRGIAVSPYPAVTVPQVQVDVRIHSLDIINIISRNEITFSMHGSYVLMFVCLCL